MNAKLTQFLMTGLAVVAGVWAYNQYVAGSSTTEGGAAAGESRRRFRGRR
tara:strand:+ start:850 stop:999 length:150 start_codon:yes stop_codon:yes gene_type:complete